MQRPQKPVSTPVEAARAPESAVERLPVQRPRVRRLGNLPAVTTAFGGSFTP